MKIIGFAAEGVSDFALRREKALIADNHTTTLSTDLIADGVDLVIQHLDQETDNENWVDLVKTSPYYIQRTNAKQN